MCFKMDIVIIPGTSKQEIDIHLQQLQKNDELPLGKKVLGSNGLTGWSLHILPMLTWVFLKTLNCP